MATQTQQALHQMTMRYQLEKAEYIAAKPCPVDGWCGYTKDGPSHGKCNHCGRRFKIAENGDLSKPDEGMTPVEELKPEESPYPNNNFDVRYNLAEYGWRRNGNLSPTTLELIRDSSLRACGMRAPKDTSDPTYSDVEMALTHIKRMGMACGVQIREDIDLNPSAVSTPMPQLTQSDYATQSQMPVVFHWRNMVMAYIHGGDASLWPNDDCALFIKALQGEI